MRYYSVSEIKQYLKSMRIPTTHSQSGQIAVVVLLIMVILLVMGLSLATRTSQESFFSQQTSETARVWNAAESGAEEALSKLSGGATPNEASVSIDNLNNSQVSATVTETKSFSGVVNQLSTVTVNLDTVSAASEPKVLDIYWGKNEARSARAALLVSVYYLEASVTKVVHLTLGSGYDRNDGFDNRWVQYDENPFPGYLLDHDDGGNASRAKIFFPAHTDESVTNKIFAGKPLFARIKPLYANANITITGTNLPAQSYIVTSTATNALPNAVGAETRKVQATRSLPSAPSILDYALYSGTTITKP
jgi:Tfp pilus assembly protein PilX